MLHIFILPITYSYVCCTFNVAPVQVILLLHMHLGILRPPSHSYSHAHRYKFRVRRQTQLVRVFGKLPAELGLCTGQYALSKHTAAIHLSRYVHCPMWARALEAPLLGHWLCYQINSLIWEARQI